MPKKYSKKFWIIFWTVSVLFLASFYYFLEYQKKGFGVINDISDYLPLSLSKKEELKTLSVFADYLLKKDDQAKTFMILFQNDMEIRPGGGYIGSFGILKIRNGHVEDLQTHDLSNFDGRIPSIVEPPYPMKKTLRIDSWKLRDSNWSPDWPTNAKKAEEFYYMGQGQEKFDGIIAINSHILTSFLKVTGPIEILGYPSRFDSEGAILNLEYQVEKGYASQGIDRGERKSVMNDLAKAIIGKISSLGIADKIKLAEIILEDLNKKDIQLYFKDGSLQKQAHLAGWSGEISQNWNKDYLAMIDANLGSFKSDYYIRRSFDYTVDFSEEAPKAILKITYNHTAKEKDWMTKDYQTYLRVYVPAESWLKNAEPVYEKNFGEDFGKKYFGLLFTVPLGTQKTITITYDLPSTVKYEDYELRIQKQSGIVELPGHITIMGKNGEKKEYDVNIKSDYTLSK
jgi:hypothetical protein